MTTLISSLNDKTSHRDAGMPVALPRLRSREADRNGRAPIGVSELHVELPGISPTVLRLFRWYARGFIARHFHAVRIAGEIPQSTESSMVVYCNHASWWDPMMLMLLGDRISPGRRNYAPVDACAIERYRFFQRLGFFGVEQNTRRGAIQFLRTSQAILNEPDTALWLTPQGRFADVRERPARFQRGLGALAARSRETVFLPIAMEYTFWEERLPEAIVQVGHPIRVGDGREFDVNKWTRLFEQTLLETQERLASAVVRRDAQGFETLLSGAGGVNWIYDGWRSLIDRLRGETFRKEHGTL